VGLVDARGFFLLLSSIGAGAGAGAGEAGFDREGDDALDCLPECALFGVCTSGVEPRRTLSNRIRCVDRWNFFIMLLLSSRVESSSETKEAVEWGRGNDA